MKPYKHGLSESHDFCRTIENDLNMEVELTPSCRVNGTFTECAQLQSCSPSNCSIGYSSCITGECLPNSKFCDFFPDCPLRDDESNCDVTNPFIPIKYTDYPSALVNTSDHVLYLDIKLETAAGDDEKYKILKIGENLTLRQSLNLDPNIFLMIQRLVFGMKYKELSITLTFQFNVKNHS